MLRTAPAWYRQLAPLMTIQARRGSLAAGLETLRGALKLSEEEHFPLFRTRTLCWLAEALAEDVRIEEGLDAVEEGLDLASHDGVRTFESELYRMRGDLLAQTQEGAEDAERAYRAALDVSRRQQARAFELRAAVGLGRLLRDQRREEEARDLVEPVYGWFTEGFETSDLRGARGLLEELR